MRYLFLVTFLVLCHSTMGDDLVQQTCKKASDADKNLNYNFCVSALEASPKSKGADLAGLAGIALDLTTAKATSIKSTISKLLNDPKVDKPALQDCEELYSDATDDLQVATNAFKSSDYGTALTHLSATLNAPDTCETGFQERKAVSPLSKDDGDFTQLNIISLAFINQLRG
ncbi:putative invertase inhibitor [Rosa sericea]